MAPSFGDLKKQLLDTVISIKTMNDLLKTDPDNYIYQFIIAVLFSTAEDTVSQMEQFITDIHTKAKNDPNLS